MAVKKCKGVADKRTRRLNLQVGDEAAERLLIHAIKSRVSPGELVTELIEQHLRRWSMPGDLSNRATSRVSGIGSDPVSDSVQPLALAG